MGNSNLLRPKLIRVTTVPLSLNLLLKNQLKMLNQSFEVIALSSPGGDLELVGKREQVRIIDVPMKRDISFKDDLISLLKLIKVFRQERPMIVHANTPKGSLLSMIAAFISNVPVRIYTVTGLRYETERGFKRKLLITMERLTCAFASHVVAESNGVKQMIYADRLCTKKIEIIGNGNLNGVDADFWDPKAVQAAPIYEVKRKYGIADKDFVFIFVGRLVGDKGINELVKAFKSFNRLNTKLILVGPLESNLDPLEEDVLIEINLNPNIITTGYQSDIRSFLSISHTLILPSYREGFPNVLLQAGAMGIPLISSDVNGAAEVIVKGKNGVIIKKKNIEELKTAMEYIVENHKNFDPGFCREYVVNKFSQHYYYPLLLNYYKRCSNVFKVF